MEGAFHLYERDHLLVHAAEDDVFGVGTSDKLPLPPLGLVPGGWCFGVAALKSFFLK